VHVNDVTPLDQHFTHDRARRRFAEASITTPTQAWQLRTNAPALARNAANWAATNLPIREGKSGKNLLSSRAQKGALPMRRTRQRTSVASAREDFDMTRRVLVAAAIAATLFGAPASAQTYPTCPITIVNPFGPGSASDTLCRIIGDKLGPMLGQPIVIEDRPGAI